jgi:hypothetical protein
MEIEESPLFAEVTKIIQGGPTDTNYGWECVFQYGDNKTYIPLKVIGVNRLYELHCVNGIRRIC